VTPGANTSALGRVRCSEGPPSSKTDDARIPSDSTSVSSVARTLRFVPPGSLVEVTFRTLHGRFLLRPSARANDLIIGVIGRAQRKYGIAIHGLVVLSNHAHLLLSAESPQELAAFMGYAAGNIASEIGRLHSWREFWARRYRAIFVSHEEEAQVRRSEGPPSSQTDAAGIPGDSTSVSSVTRTLRFVPPGSLVELPAYAARSAPASPELSCQWLSNVGRPVLFLKASEPRCQHLVSQVAQLLQFVRLWNLGVEDEIHVQHASVDYVSEQTSEIGCKGKVVCPKQGVAFVVPVVKRLPERRSGEVATSD
jgi:REP element-mobilizing transposase RayT